MDASVPLIYSPREERVRLTWIGRATALVISLGCLAVLVTAATLKPSPDGLGTHRELGLDRCAFEARTGIPCPSCGMTTSFSWFVRGNVAASLYVQPMGTVLAVLTAAIFWAGLYIAISGRAAHRLLRFVPGRYYVVPLLTWAMVAWVWKIFIHLHGIDGWR